jgi:hypothetical protein
VFVSCFVVWNTVFFYWSATYRVCWTPADRAHMFSFLFVGSLIRTRHAWWESQQSGSEEYDVQQQYSICSMRLVSFQVGFTCSFSSRLDCERVKKEGQIHAEATDGLLLLFHVMNDASSSAPIGTMTKCMPAYICTVTCTLEIPPTM